MRRSSFQGAGITRIVASLFLAAGITLTFTQIASASSPNPTVSSFKTKPASLPVAGGQITLTAQVTYARRCAFKSIPTVTGLPDSVGCSNGAVKDTVTLPVNSSGSTETYTFDLTVTGTNGFKVKTKTTTTVSVPFTGAKSIVSDGGGFCAVLSTGGVNCWGDNFYGDLGNGTFNGPHGAFGYNTPQAVSGLTDAVTVTSSIDEPSYCAVLSTGGVKCWGDNYTGQLGNGTVDGTGDSGGSIYGYDTPQTVSGLADVVSLASQSDDSQGSYCAVLTSGGVDCWGDNSWGQLGNGTVGGPDYGFQVFGIYDTPQAVIGVSDAISVTSDEQSHGYCALLSTGGVDCWGYNQDGELGNGSFAGPDGADGYDTPQPVNDLTGVTALSSSNDEGGYCALLSAGGVDCWGVGVDTPQAVSGLMDVVQVSADGSGYCVLLSTGGVDCWGANSLGQLGDGTTNSSSSPQPVSDLTNAVSVSTSIADSNCALLSTGGVDCWGDNSWGQLGNGTTGGPDGAYGYDTPQGVTGISDVVSVVSDVAEGYCAVISTSGVDCWGANGAGQLGNGTTGAGQDTPQPVSNS